MKDSGPIHRMLHAVCSTCKSCKRCWCTCPTDRSSSPLPTEQKCVPKPQRRTTNF